MHQSFLAFPLKRLAPLRLALTVEMSNCFDTPRPEVLWPFESQQMFSVCRFAKGLLQLKGRRSLMFEGSSSGRCSETWERCLRLLLSCAHSAVHFTRSLFGRSSRLGNRIIQCNCVWQAQTWSHVWAQSTQDIQPSNMFIYLYAFYYTILVLTVWLHKKMCWNIIVTQC